MKKALSIFLTLSMLIGILSCGIVLTSAGSTSLTTSFYYDFSSGSADLGANYVSAVGGTYDSTQNALFTRSNAAGTAGPQITLNNKTVAPAMGQVLAIKLKLTDTTSDLQSVELMTVNGGGVFHAVDVSSIEYAKTTAWQLLLIQLDANTLPSTLVTAVQSKWPWKSARVIFDGGKLPNTSNAVYVSWAGIFNSAANAQEHYYATTDASELPTASFWDFTSKTNEGFGNGTDATNHTYNSGANEYADEHKAAAVRFTGTNKADVPFVRLLGLSNNGKRSAMAAGQVLAIKVRTDDVTATLKDFGTISSVPKTDTSAPVTSRTYNKYRGELPAYRKTTGWQLLVIDLSADKISVNDSPLNGNWTGFHIEFDTECTANDNDYFYLSWAGVFNNRREAELYYAATTEDPANSELTALGAKRRVSDNALRFGFQMTANEVGYAEGSYEAAVAAGNYASAGLGKYSTMVIDGVERQITGFGAVLKMSYAESFDENALTVPAAKASTSSSLKAVKAEKLLSVVDDQVEFYMTVTNAAKYPDCYIYTRAYVEYIGDNGTEYAYSNMKSKSVNQILQEEAETSN